MNEQPIGIDLGTTFSLAAFLNDRNIPELIPDAKYHAEYATPSVVHVDGNHALVGRTVEHVLCARPNLSVTRHAKLRMGEESSLFVDHNGHSWTPPTISAAILKKLKNDALVKLGYAPTSVTVAVPANFTSRQRFATRNAAKQAGFSEIKIIDEPVAAAATYGLQNPGSDQTIFVYDLGGGTFDATVIHNAPDGIHVLATAGSKKIGGKYFDEAIADDLENYYKELSGKQTLSPAAREAIRQFAIEAKSNLSLSSMYRLHKDLLLDQQVHSMLYTYHHLSRVLYPMLQTTIELSEQCIRETGLGWNDIDVVLLTGGSSRLPAVKEKLIAASGFSSDKFTLFQPDEAIAFGAALVGGKSDGSLLKQQISSYDLAIQTYNPKKDVIELEKLILRNKPLPCKSVKSFVIPNNHSGVLKINLVQIHEEDEYEDAMAFEVDIPIGMKSGNKIDIEVTLQTNGIVEVACKQSEGGVSLGRLSSGVGNDTSHSYSELLNLSII